MSDSESGGVYEDASEDVPRERGESWLDAETKAEVDAAVKEDAAKDAVPQKRISIEQIPEGVGLEMLHENVMRGIQLFLANQFQDAEETFSVFSKSDPLHAICFGAMGFLKALMTFAEDDFSEASSRMEAAQLLCESLLEKKSEGVTQYFGRLFSSSSKPTMSSRDLDYTLALAESYLIRSALLLFQESIVSYVKAGLGLRKGWSYYEQCHQVICEVEKRKEYEISPDTRSGIHFGIGNVNMVISMLPNKILRIVSAFGYPGDRMVGLDELNKSLSQNGARSPLAGLSLLFYHVIYPSFFSSPSVDFHIKEAERIMHEELTKYPASAVHLMIGGRLARMKRDIDGSIVAFERAIAAQDQFLQLKHVCYYDVAWSHIFNLEWNKALPYFEKLMDENEWSKAFYTYMVAIGLLDSASDEKLTHQEAKQKQERANYLLSTIPSLVTRTFGGRTITVEQFVLKKAQLYVRNGTNTLFLPQLEIAYLWNGFSQMTPEKVQDALKLVDDTLEAAKKAPSKQTNATQEALCLLLRGTALKSLGQNAAARDCFDAVEKMDKLVKDETWIVPHAIYECGSMLLLQGDTEEGDKKLIKARDKYSDYIFELRLHLRIHLQRSI